MTLPRAWWDVERFSRFDLLVGNDEEALNAAAAAAGDEGRGAYSKSE